MIALVFLLLLLFFLLFFESDVDFVADDQGSLVQC